jgi:GT2 family glycosyltransferase
MLTLEQSLGRSTIRVLAEIVLYKTKPCESTSLNTLLAALSVLENDRADIRILLYDNTPGGQDTGVLPAGVQYKADFKNGGLATAYNYAIEIADREGFDWLLTLDQDTHLPNDFLCKLCNAASFVAPMRDVAAIVPSVLNEGKVLSPFTLMNSWTFTRHFAEGFVGIPVDNVYAVNSASMIRVSALKAIGGYDPRFHLDFSDLVIFRRLHSQKQRVFVAGNIRVEHEVSGYDLKTRSTLARYANTCRAEEAAYDEWMGRVGRGVLTLRLIYRLVYQLWRNGGDFSYFKIAWRFLCRRLFYSRKQRLDSWRNAYDRST